MKLEILVMPGCTTMAAPHYSGLLDHQASPWPHGVLQHRALMRPQSLGRAKTSAEKNRLRTLRPPCRLPATTASPWLSPSRAREYVLTALSTSTFWLSNLKVHPTSFASCFTLLAVQAAMDALTSALSNLSAAEKAAAIAHLMADSAMPSPAPSATPSVATTPIHGGGVTITIPPQVVLDHAISGPDSPRHEPLEGRDPYQWMPWDGSYWRPWYYLAEGKAPPNATRIDWDHKTFSLDPAFAMNVRVAVHPLGPREPPYPPSYDEEGERNALRLLANSAYINLPSGQPLRLPVTVRQRAAREMAGALPAQSPEVDNTPWPSPASMSHPCQSPLPSS